MQTFTTFTHLFMNAYHVFPYLLNVVVHIIHLYNIYELYLLGYISVKYYFMSRAVYH